MRTAQMLYEEGYITYMRTDSVNLSSEAIHGSRNAIQSLFGKEYLPDKPRLYKNKVKNAQEAHEAIRPAGSIRLPRASSHETQLFMQTTCRGSDSTLLPSLPRGPAGHLFSTDEGKWSGWLPVPSRSITRKPGISRRTSRWYFETAFPLRPFIRC